MTRQFQDDVRDGMRVMSRTRVNQSLYKTIKNWQTASRDELAMRVRALALFNTFHDIPHDVYEEWTKMKTALLTMKG